MLKNPLDVWWGLLPITHLLYVGRCSDSCLLSSIFLLLFDGYLVDAFHFFFIMIDVGICRFSRGSMLLV